MSKNNWLPVNSDVLQGRRGGGWWPRQELAECGNAVVGQRPRRGCWVPWHLCAVGASSTLANGPCFSMKCMVGLM